MIHRTLRARFAIWTTGLLLVFLAVFCVYIYGSMSRGLAVAMDRSLSFSAAQAAAALDVDDGDLGLPDGLGQEATPDPLVENPIGLRVVGLSGQTLLEAGPRFSFPVVSGSVSEPGFLSALDPAHDGRIRIYTLPVRESGKRIGTVQVAQSFKEIDLTLRRLLVTLVIGSALLGVLAAFGGYHLAARALRPIDEITRTAGRISAEDLGARLNLPTTDDEVGRLAATFDSMLERLQKSFFRERQFTADASHELRTPVTAVLTILGTVGEKQRTPEEYRVAFADLAEESERLRSLTDSLLHVARGSSSTADAPELTDLSTLLRDVTDSLRPLAESKGLTLTCEAPDGLALLANSDDLIRLFFNLAQNAVKYTHKGKVEVSASQVGSAIRVLVADTGIGIPACDLPFIFDRFYRVDKARGQGGVGLGLAIAVGIARAHGGSIRVHSEVGAGSTFTVDLTGPVQPPGR